MSDLSRLTPMERRALARMDARTRELRAMTDTTQTTDHAAAIRQCVRDFAKCLPSVVWHTDEDREYHPQKIGTTIIDHTDALARNLDAANTTATRLRLALIEMATVYLHSDVTDRAIRRGTIRNVLATNRVADQVGLELGDMDAGRDAAKSGKIAGTTERNASAVLETPRGATPKE